MTVIMTESEALITIKHNNKENRNSQFDNCKVAPSQLNPKSHYDMKSHSEVSDTSSESRPAV